MNCKQISLYLTDYISGNLGKNLKYKVEAHLSACAACKSEIEELVLINPSEIPDDKFAFESTKFGLGLFNMQNSK